MQKKKHQPFCLKYPFLRHYHGLLFLLKSQQLMEFPDGLAIKDLELSLLRLRFNPWLRKFHMLWAWPPPPPTRDVCSVILNHPASCRAHIRVDKREFSYIQIFLNFCYIPDPVPSEERPWQRPPRGPAPAGGLLPSMPGWPSLQPDGGSKWPICEHVPRE